MALIKCSECRGEISEKAEKCPRCGAPVKKKTGGCAMLFAIVAGVFLVGYIVSLSNSSTSTQPPSRSLRTQEARPQPTNIPSDSLEHQLAIIDAKGHVADDDASEARFGSLLLQLADTFSETKQMIADTSVKAQQILKKNGIEERVLNIMEGMNQIFPGKAENQKYAQTLALYVALRDKGRTHVEAIGDLKEMIRTLSSVGR